MRGEQPLGEKWWITASMGMATLLGVLGGGWQRRTLVPELNSSFRFIPVVQAEF